MKEATKDEGRKTNGRRELPLGWRRTTIGASLRVVRGISFPKDVRTDRPNPGYVSCLRTTNVQHEVEWDDLWFVPEKYVKREEQFVLAGDILISTANSLELVGKVAQVKALPSRSTLGAFISLIRVPPEFDPSFIYYQLASAEIQTNLRSVASTTTNISNISTGKLAQIEIGVAPLQEQRRIVAKIDELLTSLDAGVASLKRVQAALKRYRAAVLKAACEGRLVPQDPNDEPAEKLLERILAERRAKWEADLRAKGKDLKKTKYEEPKGPETERLGELPRGWCWAAVGQICLVDVGFAFESSKFVAHGIRLLRGDNIEPGALRWENLRYWPKERLSAFQHLLLREGDIVLAMDRPLISAGLKIARVKANDVPSLLVQRMARFRMVDESLVNYLYQMLQTDRFIRHLFVGQTGTQLPHISGNNILSFVVPIAPLNEQNRLIAEVERRLSVVKVLEKGMETNLARAERLRHAILRRAFEGKLVPQEHVRIRE